MRAKAKVVGNTLVLEENLALPEGAEVDLVLRIVGDDASEAVLAELRAAK